MIFDSSSFFADRALLLGTSAPFESSDAEDKNIVGVGEVLTRVMMDFEAYNRQNPDAPIKPVSASTILQTHGVLIVLCSRSIYG